MQVSDMNLLTRMVALFNPGVDFSGISDALLRDRLDILLYIQYLITSLIYLGSYPYLKLAS